MPILHMETDRVRQTARIIMQAVEAFRQQMQDESPVICSLEWEGRAHDEFITDFEALAARFNHLCDEGVFLGQRVEREVEEWEGVDLAGVKRLAGTVTSGMAIVDPGVFEDIGDSLRKAYWQLVPYDLREGMDYLQGQPAGQDLIAAAASERAKITFVLPNGDKIGYLGADATVVTIKFGEGVGGGSQQGDELIIGFEYRNSKEQLAAAMAHEMQHMLDEELKLKRTLVSPVELQNYFTQPVDIQQSIRERLANEIEARIDSEIRAYERSRAVLTGHTYPDDGVMTAYERQIILDKRIDDEWGDYESFYECTYSKSSGGHELDVWLDSQGEVHVDIKQPRPQDDEWWLYA